MNPSGDKPKGSASPRSFKLRLGRFSFWNPAGVLWSLRKNTALWILSLAVALNLYLTLSNQNGRGRIIPGLANGEAIAFSRTFLFWTPDFSQSQCALANPESSEQSFNARLEQKFGGWTRWRVTGNGPEGKMEDGWFYQVSLAKKAPPVSLNDLEALLKECFRQSSYYVIENQHR
jgi:hypothetical protein